MPSSQPCSRMSPQTLLDTKVSFQQAQALLWVSSLIFSDYISAVLAADEGVIRQSPTPVPNHQRSSPAVSGGHEEAPPPTPSHPEPGDLHEERREGGLSSPAGAVNQSEQEEPAGDIAPSAVGTNCPPAARCTRRTSDQDRPGERPEDAGSQEETGVKREEKSDVGVSLLAVGSHREQVEAESSKEAEPSDETSL